VRRIIGLAEQQGGAAREPHRPDNYQPTGNPATISALPTMIRFFRSHGYLVAL